MVSGQKSMYSRLAGAGWPLSASQRLAVGCGIFRGVKWRTLRNWESCVRKRNGKPKLMKTASVNVAHINAKVKLLPTQPAAYAWRFPGKWIASEVSLTAADAVIKV